MRPPAVDSKPVLGEEKLIDWGLAGTLTGAHF
jgi:hypothetical protein